MKYKNYIAEIEYDEMNEIFHGEVINIRDVITFQGSSISELKKAFKDSIDDYIDFCLARKEKPDTPFSGLLTFHIPLQKQKEIYNKAKTSGKKFDEWILQKLNV
ncbi:MAG: type II toxin-antitoxin system HicB family antitoxin [FCB group bacterium]|jgi:predicted HicB family RNase H-like nuclease